MSLLKLLKYILLSKYWKNYIIMHNLMDPLFQVYLKNIKKGNLILSICQEYFDILRKEGHEELEAYFVEKFG
jgi:hypothetical protein